MTGDFVDVILLQLVLS